MAHVVGADWKPSPWEIALLTEAIFLRGAQAAPCDILFVFGGTDPGHVQATLAAYHRGLAPQVVITGGVKPGAPRHPAWPGGMAPEARAIRAQLIAGGVPRSRIRWEERSRNSLENVRAAQELWAIGRAGSILFVGKSFAAGRQRATLRGVLGAGPALLPWSFDATGDGVTVRAGTWSGTAIGRARVLGEYLR